jgi:hypothetical protein
MIKAGGQEAATGPLTSSPIRFIRGAVRSFQEAPQSIAETQMRNYSRLPLASQEPASSPSLIDPRDQPLAWEAPPVPKGPPQGTYVKLPDGSWGVKALEGHKLIPGESVNVMSRGGIPRMHVVGNIGEGGAATLGEAAEPLPTVRTPRGDLVPMNDRLRELIRATLAAQ